MIGPKEKKERSLGVKLGLKAERCQGPKCVTVRRPNRPGVHGTKRQRRNMSDFGRQIREKQKFKISYGIDERNLRSLFLEASRSRDISSTLMSLLERRLDNVFFRLGLAGSRSQGRQLIIQGHAMVNGSRVRSPGFHVKPGDVVSLHENAAGFAAKRKEAMVNLEIPEWLSLDRQTMQGTVLRLPLNVEPPFELSLLVESFSK